MAVDDSERFFFQSPPSQLFALGPEECVFVVAVAAEGDGEADEGADEEEGGTEGIAAGGGLF